MRKILLLAFALAGCGERDGEENVTNIVEAAPPAPPSRQAQTATLTGLYESAGQRPSQICITQQGGAARFGLVTWQGQRPGCSGAGSAVRTGAMLRLTMDGDSPCVIDARLEGARVTFPANLPRGCSYYCAPGAGAAAVQFSKTGGTAQDAMRARDIVGDPLCS